MTDVDVVIIGAGISGLGAAYRITERNPGTSYVILERREQIGGTWDLFRYPGVRSDSSIFTLCFPLEPWTRKEGVADGEHIREYLTATAHKYGIDQHIRFNSHVRSADWDSSTDTWTVTRRAGRRPRRPTAAASCSSGPATTTTTRATPPTSPASNEFGGTVVHPQHWPEDLDYTRQEGRGHRQRRHRDVADPVAGREGRQGHHAAALADLSVLGVQDTAGH